VPFRPKIAHVRTSWSQELDKCSFRMKPSQGDGRLMGQPSATLQDFRRQWLHHTTRTQCNVVSKCPTIAMHPTIIRQRIWWQPIETWWDCSSVIPWLIWNLPPKPRSSSSAIRSRCEYRFGMLRILSGSDARLWIYTHTYLHSKNNAKSKKDVYNMCEATYQT